MNESRFAPSLVYPAALRRVGMAAVLLVAFGAYARRSSPAALIAAALPARSQSVSVAPSGGHVVMHNASSAVSMSERDGAAMGDLLSALGIPRSGAPITILTDKAPSLDGISSRELMDETAAGVVGPTMRRLMAEAEKKGAMDLPLYAGRSLRQIRDHALALGAKADALAEESRRRNAEALGIEPATDSPEAVVPRMLERLDEPIEDRIDAAQVLCDVRYARWPGAVAALPKLDALARVKDPEAAFAEIAAQRIRYFEAKRSLDAKYMRR